MSSYAQFFDSSMGFDFNFGMTRLDPDISVLGASFSQPQNYGMFNFFLLLCLPKGKRNACYSESVKCNRSSYVCRI